MDRADLQSVYNRIGELERELEVRTEALKQSEARIDSKRAALATALQLLKGWADYPQYPLALHLEATREFLAKHGVR